MISEQEPPILSDAQKLEMRPALARLHGALMRAWQLGMFVPASEADRQLLRETRRLVVVPEHDSATLSDAEYLAVFDHLFTRFRALAAAYRRDASAPGPAERVLAALSQPSAVTE